MTTTYRFKLRHDTAANWTTANPVLLAGEPGVETDTDLFKFGDGVTAWTALDYANDTSGSTMSAADILTAVKTVDGAGSGLDADLLDGSSSAAFETAGAASTAQAAAIAAAATDATTKANTSTSTAAAALSAHAAAADPHPTYLTSAEGNAAYDATGAAAAAQAASQPLATPLTNTTAAFTTAQETKLAGIETAATADQTAAEILTAIKTVDGAGSGLDADLLDGVSSAGFDVAGAAAAAQAASQPLATVLTNTTASFTTAQETKLSGIATGAQVNDTAAQILTKLLTVDGASSGLDADLLDGTSSAGFATAAQGTTADTAVQTAQAINAQTGTTYTLVAADAGKLVTLSNGSAITLTVPQDSDATIAVGTYIDLYQLGAGQVTVAAGTGATLRTSGLTAKARAQYARVGVQKVSANTWSLMGDLAAS